uniref:Uncharacterized protein n=2 Tax=Opuntia streptacantha TaxID=393608 RepID=A0A7C9DNH6_OPUST
MTNTESHRPAMLSRLEIWLVCQFRVRDSNLLTFLLSLSLSFVSCSTNAHHPSSGIRSMLAMKVERHGREEPTTVLGRNKLLETLLVVSESIETGGFGRRKMKEGGLHNVLQERIELRLQFVFPF